MDIPPLSKVMDLPIRTIGASFSTLIIKHDKLRFLCRSPGDSKISPHSQFPRVLFAKDLDRQAS